LAKIEGGREYCSIVVVVELRTHSHQVSPHGPMQFKRKKERPLLLPLGQARNESNKTHAKHQRGELLVGKEGIATIRPFFLTRFTHTHTHKHTHTVHIYIYI
jgi:hypothetical protein